MHFLVFSYFIIKIKKMYETSNLTNNNHTLQAFHDLSFGTFPFLDCKTNTADVTLITANGGDPNDFSSVKLF